MLFYIAREKQHRRQSRLLYSVTNKHKKPTSLRLNHSQTVITFTSKSQTLSQPSQSLGRSCSLTGKSILTACSVQEESRCQNKAFTSRSSSHLTVGRETTSAACSDLRLQLCEGYSLPVNNIHWDEHLVTPSGRAVLCVLHPIPGVANPTGRVTGCHCCDQTSETLLTSMSWAEQCKVML